MAKMIKCIIIIYLHSTAQKYERPNTYQEYNNSCNADQVDNFSFNGYHLDCSESNIFHFFLFFI